MEIRGDGAHNSSEFINAKSVLLGSEELRFVAQETDGFIVLSDRRFLYLKKEKDGYRIQYTVPLDLVTGAELEKKGTLRIDFHKIYDSGVLDAKFSKSKLEFRMADIKVRFPETTEESTYYINVDEFNSTLKHTLNSSPYSDGVFKGRDYSYLASIPESVTRDGILHVNTILTDRPEEDYLYGSAKKAFGEHPFILLNVLQLKYRGYLFVVGEKAMMFLQGNYSYGSVSRMNLVDFEPQQVLNISADWTNKNLNTFHITKPLRDYDKVKFGKIQFEWKPPKNPDVQQVPWFCDAANAVWIIADMVLVQQKELIKANYGTGEEIDDPRIMRQRYYW